MSAINYTFIIPIKKEQSNINLRFWCALYYDYQKILSQFLLFLSLKICIISEILWQGLWTGNFNGYWFFGGLVDSWMIFRRAGWKDNKTVMIRSGMLVIKGTPVANLDAKTGRESIKLIFTISSFQQAFSHSNTHLKFYPPNSP